MRLALAFCLTIVLNLALTVIAAAIVLVVVFVSQGAFRDGINGPLVAELMTDRLLWGLQLGVGLPCTFLAAWIGARVARRAERLMPPLAMLTLSLASFLWSQSAKEEPLQEALLLVLSLLAALAGGELARRGRLKREAARARAQVAQF